MMAATGVITLRDVNIASVDRFRVTLRKDGAIWNLSAGSVQFVFEKPDRVTQLVVNATAENAAAGIFYYDTLVTDFDVTGQWTMNVRVTDGSVVKRYPYEIGFRVNDNP